MRLNGKKAIITGGARAIGRAFAEAYIREGAQVVIADIDGNAADAAAAELGDRALARRLDVTDTAAIEETVAELDRTLEGIDILINNAGVFDMAPVTHVTDESYRRVFDVNVRGPIFMMKTVANTMIARRRGGKIINMASQAGRRGEALVLVYCASKAAIISATQSAALALAEHNIQVNGISPGVVDGPMWDEVDAHFAKWENRAVGEKRKLVGEAVPLGRMGVPEDLAPMAVFLGSSDSDYVTAQTYNVDGGNWMS